MHGYVGMSKDPESRFKDHWRSRLEGKTYKCCWLRSLQFLPQLIILQRCKETTWQKWERIWIRDLRLGGLILTNLTEGGEGVIGRTGWKHSKETKAKMSVWQIGKQFSEETKRKLREAAKNRPPMSEETRGKISKAGKGLKRSLETRKKMSEGRKGKKHSEETKRRIGLKKKGQRHSEETKRKLSLKSKGKKRPPFSEEWKKNMSLAMKGRIPWNKGVPHSKETKVKIGNANKGRRWKHSKASRMKMSIAKKRWWREQRRAA